MSKRKRKKAKPVVQKTPESSAFWMMLKEVGVKIRPKSGNVLMVLNPVPDGGRRRLSLWLSTDDGRTWPVWRDLENGPGHSSYPAMIRGRDGRVHVTYSRPDGGMRHVTLNEAWVWEAAMVDGEFTTANLVPVSYTHLTLPTILRV